MGLILGWENPMEEETATHSSILAGEANGREAWWVTVLRVAKSWTQLSTDTHIINIVKYMFTLNQEKW